MADPQKPSVFDAEHAPIGVEVKFVPFAGSRLKMKPRLQLVHTNAANGEGTIESAWNWTNAKPGVNTLPHYQVDRSGRARKMLPTDRVGIANATVDAYQGSHGDVRNFSLAYETADDGYGPGRLGDESGFTPAQAETLAQILAYESIVHGIPLETPTAWYGAGTAAHTDPFTYPYWTMYKGKSCPGRLKKQQLRGQVIPRARQIVAAWTAKPATPKPPVVVGPIPQALEEDEMAKPLLLRAPDNAVYITDRYSYAHRVENEPHEGEHLRDTIGAVCRPDGSPWPCDEVEAAFLARIAS